MRLLFFLFLVHCSEYQVAKDAESDEPVGTTVPDAVEPDIEVNPFLINFGELPVDSEAVTALVNVKNVGLGALDISGATIADPAGPYTVTAIDGATLLTDESFDLVVEFTPSDDGFHRDQLIISSNDPDEPSVPVELEATATTLDEPDLPGTPDLLATPLSHHFGVIATSEVASTMFTLANVGDSALTIDDIRLMTDTSEMGLDIQPEINSVLPWVVEPGDNRRINVHYAPVDDVLDVAQVVVSSDDPDTPEEVLAVTGNGRPFEGFSAGWYIYDDGLDHETTSSPDHPVTTHGDADLYWYEPSGAHGLIDSVDPETDFALMRDYVIAGAGAPTEVTGPLTFSSSSHLSTFAFATFTYVMCDFWIDPTEDPSRFTVSADSVDDGIQVMVNGEILGRMLLGAAPTSWSLADVGRPGEVNTLIVILVDDSASHRYLTNLAFYKDGVMVE